MTDLESLRSALREPPSESFSAPDLAKIMADGGRIRRRRRLATGGGVAAAVVAVVVVIFGAGELGRSGTVSTPAAAPTLSVAVPSATSEFPVPKHTQLGTLVDTGISSSQGELMIYGVKIDGSVAPGVTFGMMAGVRDATGSVTDVYLGNQTSGSDVAPGFHSLNGTLNAAGTFIPTFGYYVGPAAKITTTVHGQTVQAHLAQWSENSAVKILWFAQQDVPDSNLMTPPKAYDAAGNLLSH